MTKHKIIFFKRRRFWFIIVAVILILLISITWFFWWYTNQFIASDHPKPSFPELVKQVTTGKNDSVIISMKPSPATEREGQYGMYWQGGYALVGRIIHKTDTGIDRIMLMGKQPYKGVMFGMNWTYPTDPKGAYGYDFFEDIVDTELGVAPAWNIPANKNNKSFEGTWAITVHGSNSDRHSPLQIIRSLHEAGLPVLDITYRNDVGAPQTPDQLLHLGLTEWKDLEAAVKKVISEGARNIILYGGSMGGGIVLEFLKNSSLAKKVTGIILDCPMLSVPAMVTYISEEHHSPSLFNPLIIRLMNWRLHEDIHQTDMLIYPPTFQPPMLLMQGMKDNVMPLQTAREFVANEQKKGWEIHYVEFPDAGHVECWNTDVKKYEDIASAFLASIRNSSK